MIESLQKHHHYYGDSLKVELPRYSNNWRNLTEVATDLSHRLIRIFLRDEANGRYRPVFGGIDYFQLLRELFPTLQDVIDGRM